MSVDQVLKKISEAGEVSIPYECKYIETELPFPHHSINLWVAWYRCQEKVYFGFFDFNGISTFVGYLIPKQPL